MIGSGERSFQTSVLHFHFQFAYRDKLNFGRSIMGRVTCEVKVENAIDLALAREGKIDLAAVRTIQLTDALVDTGASTSHCRCR
jgi:hypothetical protein